MLMSTLEASVHKQKFSAYLGEKLTVCQTKTEKWQKQLLLRNQRPLRLPSQPRPRDPKRAVFPKKAKQKRQQRKPPRKPRNRLFICGAVFVFLCKFPTFHLCT